MTADNTSSLEPEWNPPEIETLAAMLPQYRIERLIGMSATGTIYGAVQLVLDRPVAIRLLAAELGGDELFKARFQREARTLATLQHPGIVAIYDFGQTSEGDLYFVMEFVDGTDLSQIIQGASLAPAQALDLTVQICEALQHAHSAGLVHRDIKPANVLVTRSGRAKLADFGLARPLGDDHSGSSLSTVSTRSPDYLAPEQREGLADQRTDIYALGMLLYEMLTGGRPAGAFPLPSTKVRIDVRLDQVVIKALQQESDRRYQHVSEMKTDVDQIRSTPPPNATAPPASGKTTSGTRRAWRNKRLSIAAAIIFPFIVVGGSYVWNQIQRGIPNDPKASIGTDGSNEVKATETTTPAHVSPVAGKLNPLPTDARPEGFSGAMGEFTFVAEGSPRRVKVGDPVTMKLTIKGSGTFPTNAPSLKSRQGWRVYPASADFRNGGGLSGTKTFTLPVIPETQQKTMPVFEFTYFDPSKRDFVTLQSEAQPLVVEGGSPATPSSAKEPPSAPAVSGSKPTPDFPYTGRIKSIVWAGEEFEPRYLGELKLNETPIGWIRTRRVGGLAFHPDGRIAFGKGYGTTADMALSYWDRNGSNTKPVVALEYQSYTSGKDRDVEEAAGRFWFFTGQLAFDRAGSCYFTLGAGGPDGLYKVLSASPVKIEKLRPAGAIVSLQIPYFDATHFYVTKSNSIFLVGQEKASSWEAGIGDPWFSLFGKDIKLRRTLAVTPEKLMFQVEIKNPETAEGGNKSKSVWKTLVCDRRAKAYWSMPIDGLGPMAVSWDGGKCIRFDDSTQAILEFSLPRP